MSESNLNRLMKKILLLSARISFPLKEDELVKIFVDTICDTFEGSRCCVRLIDHESGALLSAYARGILEKDLREYLFITSGAFEDGCIPAGMKEGLSSNVHILDEPRCIFQATESCVLIALCLGSELYGTLHLEYSGQKSFSQVERLFLSVVGSILASAISNFRYLRELRYLRDYMNKLIDHANVPIVVLDRGNRIKSFNQTIEKITGYSKEDVKGSDFFNFLSERDRQRFLPVLMNAFQGRSTAGFEVHVLRKDGKENIPMAFNIASVSDIHGEVDDVVVIGQDLTEVRRLQNQMLHTERLMTIGQLSAGVAHEINNPLTSISVYSDYLLKKYEKKDMEAIDLVRIRRIVSSADRILKFTKELISFARPTAEEPLPVDLREIAAHSIGFCEHVITMHSITVIKDFPESLPHVYGIKAQLQQIMVNLITNACHAMKETGEELKVRIRDRKDGTILTEIEDTGVGMPADVVSKAFDPFFTTKAEGEGTGLGLSIVKNIMDNHQGEISIRSEVGKGTTVSFVLYTLE